MHNDNKTGATPVANEKIKKPSLIAILDNLSRLEGFLNAVEIMADGMDNDIGYSLHLVTEAAAADAENIRTSLELLQEIERGAA